MQPVYPLPTQRMIENVKDPVLPASVLAHPTAPDEDITEEKAQRAMARLKTRCITPQIINDLSIVGRYTKKIGVLGIVRGALMEGLSRMKYVAEMVDDRIETIKSKQGRSPAVRKEISELLRVQTEVSRRLNEMSTTLIEAEGQLPPAPPQSDEPKIPSFGAGQQVGPQTTTVYAKEVHMHSQPQSDVKSIEPPQSVG